MQTRTLRTARLEDVDQLQQLIALSARGLNAEDYTPDQVESILKFVYGVDSQLILDQTYFVVEQSGHFLGCGGWSRRKTLYGGDQHKANDPDDLLNPTTDSARIRAFFVHPKGARQGIGSLLMQACEDAAREAGFRSMELMATLTGEYLYTKFGFITVGEEDVVLPDRNIMKVRPMRKQLSL